MSEPAADEQVVKVAAEAAAPAVTATAEAAEAAVEATIPERGFRHFRRTSARYHAIWNAVTAYLVFYVAISPFGRQPGVVHLVAALGAVALLAGGLLLPKAASGSYRWFREFRRTRPFYAALWIAIGGLVLFYLTKSPPKYLPHVGVGGIYGMGAGIALWLIALLVLLLPSQRYVGGAIAVVLGVVSFPLSNLGGFFVGMFFSVLGGSMAFGWMPEKPEKKRRWFRKIQAPMTGAGVTGAGVTGAGATGASA